MNKLIKLCLTPLAFAISTAVAADTNWNGYYYGMSLNHVQNSNKTHYKTGDDLDPSHVRWVDNQFHGDVLNSIDSMTVEPLDHLEVYEVITLNPLNDISSSHSALGATLLMGKDTRFDNIMLGGEFKLSFGNFGATHDQALNNSGTFSISDHEGSTFSYTNYNSSITGLTSPQMGSGMDEIVNSVDYSQSITNQNSYKMNHMLSFSLRTGWIYNQVMVYGLAGVAYAKVNAKTSLTVSESATGVLEVDHDEPIEYTGSSSYSFNGASSKHMVGYTVGAGAEWAIKNNLRLRLEGAYYNLGKISTTGISEQTLASYTVSQDVSSYNFSIGLVRDF